MTYKQLAEFIDKGMRMSHIYQPVMLVELLRNKGRLDDQSIAKALLSHDQSQIDYYTRITNNMVGRVLRNHGIVERDRASREYKLVGFNRLKKDQINDLINRCQKRLAAYVEARGNRLYKHRRLSIGYISGTLRYDILKRAKFRCELCGISADEKALEVDHILPRNHGGSDDPSNLQTLCYSCNAMKRDRDSTDFRAIKKAYATRSPNCIFCDPDNSRILDQNELAYAIADGFPVSPGHVLIVPKRHIEDYFDLGQAEINACTSLLSSQRKAIQATDSTATGFNVGVNVGRVAGQTINHCHIHLIPRRKGDVTDPIGGVRSVIPEKANYLKRKPKK